MKKDMRFAIGLSLAIISAVLAFAFDAEIVRFIVGIRNLFLGSVADYLLLSVNFLSNIIIIFFFLTTLFLWKKKKRWIFPLSSGIVLTGVAVFLLKIIFRRSRPFQEGVVPIMSVPLQEIIMNLTTNWNFSFPSMQTALVFATVPLVNKNFGKFKYYWLIFACLIGFSRIYFGMHYLSDVLAGAVIGYLTGLGMIILSQKYRKNLEMS
jgi:undecaprenyl-diphosphatase